MLCYGTIYNSGCDSTDQRDPFGDQGWTDPGACQAVQHQGPLLDVRRYLRRRRCVHEGCNAEAAIQVTATDRATTSMWADTVAVALLSTTTDAALHQHSRSRSRRCTAPCCAWPTTACGCLAAGCTTSVGASSTKATPCCAALEPTKQTE